MQGGAVVGVGSVVFVEQGCVVGQAVEHAQLECGVGQQQILVLGVDVDKTVGYMAPARSD